MKDGVYRNGQLIYVGSTTNFEQRWKDHKSYIRNKDYKLIKPEDNIEFKILIKGR